MNKNTKRTVIDVIVVACLLSFLLLALALIDSCVYFSHRFSVPIGYERIFDQIDSAIGVASMLSAAVGVIFGIVSVRIFRWRVKK